MMELLISHNIERYIFAYKRTLLKLLVLSFSFNHVRSFCYESLCWLPTGMIRNMLFFLCRAKEQDRDTERCFMATQSYCVIKTATWYGEINILPC